jgi:hypothetical protein
MTTRSRAKITILLVLDAAASVFVAPAALLNLVDQYLPPTVIEGSLVNKPKGTQRVGKTRRTTYYLGIRTSSGITQLKVNEIVADAFILGDSVRVAVTPNLGIWQRVESVTTGKVRTASKGPFFWGSMVIAALMPLFLRREWLSLDWGRLLWAGCLWKVVALSLLL